MARHRSSKGPSQRQLRVGEMVRHRLADILARELVADPALEGGHVTVTEAKMAPDLRHATIYVRPFGADGKDSAALLVALRRHARFLRGELAKHVDLKFMPELVFRIDETFDEASRIDALLRSPNVARDLDNTSKSD
jgi:ribosome-binding factor A